MHVLIYSLLSILYSQDHRVVVRIDSWESTSLYPNGHTVRVLGRAGELETEVQTILIENCIHVPPFSDAQVRKSKPNFTGQTSGLITAPVFVVWNL